MVSVVPDSVTDRGDNANSTARVTHEPRPGPVRDVSITGGTDSTYTVAWVAPEFGADGLPVDTPYDGDDANNKRKYRFQQRGGGVWPQQTGVQDVNFNAVSSLTVTDLTADEVAANGFNIQGVLPSARRSNEGTAVPPKPEIIGVEKDPSDNDDFAVIWYKYWTDQYNGTDNPNVKGVVTYDIQPLIQEVVLQRCLATPADDCTLETSTWTDARTNALGRPGGLAGSLDAPGNGERVRYRLQFGNDLASGEWSDPSEIHTAVDTTAPDITINNPTQTSAGNSRTFSATATDEVPASHAAVNTNTMRYQK